MRKIISTMLLAGAMLAATPANAALYVKYTFDSRGTGTLITQGRMDPMPTFRSLEGFSLTFVVPLTGFYSIYFNHTDHDRFSAPATPGSNALGAGNVGMDAYANTLSFYSGGSSDGGGTFDVKGSICGSFGGVLPTSSFTTDPSCSSLNANYSGRGFSVFYGGAITNTKVEVLNGDILGYGVVGVTPIIPEPATWAMMLVGFAMVGATARYRRRKVAATFA